MKGQAPVHGLKGQRGDLSWLIVTSTAQERIHRKAKTPASEAVDYLLTTHRLIVKLAVPDGI